jgi:hypothetical protein
MRNPYEAKLIAGLPIKAIEMLMDKSIYKLGVQIRGESAMEYLREQG